MTQSITWLQDEIADRMLQKLDIVKLDVRNVLLIPEFPGRYLSTLAKRFPGARIHGISEEHVTGLEALRFRAKQLWRRLFQGGNSRPLSA